MGSRRPDAIGLAASLGDPGGGCVHASLDVDDHAAGGWDPHVRCSKCLAPTTTTSPFRAWLLMHITGTGLATVHSG